MTVTRHPLFSDDGRLAGVPADRVVTARLRQSLAGVLGRGDELVERFYARLFTRHPELRALFPADVEGVRCRVRAGLALLVSKMDQPDSIASELARIGRLHADHGVRPEHYPPASACLLETLAELSGERWDEDVEREWRQTLRAVTAAMLRAARAR